MSILPIAIPGGLVLSGIARAAYPSEKTIARRAQRQAERAELLARREKSRDMLHRAQDHDRQAAQPQAPRQGLTSRFAEGWRGAGKYDPDA